MFNKNTFRKTAITIYCFFLFQAGISQENFLKGYLIMNNGDTVNGYIDYRNWGKNPDKILFKTHLDENSIIHTPISIQSFQVAEEIYQSAIILNDLSPEKTGELEHGKEPNTKIDTIFLQSLILGPKNLFLYKNESGRELYYIKQDSTYTLLVYKRYISDRYATDIKENKWYLNQLAVYLNDCPSIQENYKNLKYSGESLEKLFRSYYECVDESYKYKKKKEKVIAEFGAIAGLTLNDLSFGGAESLVLTGFDFKTDVNYTIGTYLNLLLARNQRKWSLYNELAFSPYKIEHYYEDYVSENEYNYYTTTFGYSYLKLNTLVRFTYPFGNTSFFINAGMSNGYALSEINQVHVEKKFYSSEIEEDYVAIPSTRLYEQGYIVGLGGKYDKFSFELRYERGNGMSAIMNLDSKTKRCLFLLGYKFGK